MVLDLSFGYLYFLVSAMTHLDMESDEDKKQISFIYNYIRKHIEFNAEKIMPY